MEYVKFGKVSVKNYRNILQRAHHWAWFHMKNYSSVSLLGTLCHMCKCGQFYLNFMWVIPLTLGIDVRRAPSIW